MSQRFRQLLATPEGIGAGQTATLRLPLGPTYHAFYIRLNAQKGTVATDITSLKLADYLEKITIKVDGNVTYEMPVALLVKRAAFYGATIRAGILPIYLDLFWARTIMGEDLGAYSTGGGITSFTMDIKIADGKTINKLEVYSEESYPAPGESNPFGWHLQVHEFSDFFGAAGEQEIGIIPRGQYHLLQVDFDNSAVDRIEVFANNSRIHVSDLVVREQGLLDSGRVAQANMTHLDFIPKNRIALVRQTANGPAIDPEALFMDLQSFRLKVGWTAAPSAFKLYATSLRTANDI